MFSTNTPKRKTSKKPTKKKNKSNAKKPVTKPKKRTKADKIYRKLRRKGLANKLHIYEGGEPCASIALDYVDNIPLIDTELNKVCRNANKTKPHHYYQYTKLEFKEIGVRAMSKILSDANNKNKKK